MPQVSDDTSRDLPSPTHAAARRIIAVRAAHPHYREATPDAFVRDLLTDVRHFAETQNLDFYQALGGSYRVYLEERAAAVDP